MKSYTLDLSCKQQKELGFRYDSKLDEYVYEFPVYLYKGRPNIICKLGIKEDTNEVWYQVCNTEGNTYSANYNRVYGVSKIVLVIDRNIQKELRKLGAKEHIERTNR